MSETTVNLSYTFAPSASATIPIPAGLPVGMPLSLPAVDAANLDARVTNQAGIDAWLTFGAGAYLPAGQGVDGCVHLRPEATAIVLARAGLATGVGVALGAVWAGSMLFERGTATPATQFSGAAVL